MDDKTGFAGGFVGICGICETKLIYTSHLKLAYKRPPRKMRRQAKVARAHQSETNQTSDTDGK